MTVVDAHLHVWDLEQGDYAWLGPDLGTLYRSFLPSQAADELATAGVTSAILVQAEDSVRETRYLLGVAEQHAWVHGVVGWVQLDDPERAERELDELSHPALRGVRHLIHDDPRPDFLDLAPVRRSLAQVAERGLVLDVPNAWPRHLDSVGRLAEAVPDLTVVLDHLAKPPRERADFDEWERSLRQLAQYPQVVAKVSGLQVPGQPFTAAALRPALDVALDAFGVDRLMFGSDWPMTTDVGGYPVAFAVTQELVGGLSAEEQQAVWGGTATRIYGRSFHE